MRSDARAKKVLKELSALLVEVGIKTPVGSRKDAVGRLFGYGSWADMLDALDGEADLGPEDHKLDADSLSIRRRIQGDAVRPLLVGRILAEDLIERLRPTGKTEQSIKAFGRVRSISNWMDYHPLRLDRIWEEIDRLHERCDGSEYDGSSHGAAVMLAGWSATRANLALDQWFAGSSLERVSDRIDKFSKTSILTSDWRIPGCLIDASAALADLKGRPFSHNLLRGPRPMTAYVHLGPNAFPSPYSDVGVEGAYITFEDSDVWNSATPSARAVLVCSVPHRGVVGNEGDPDAGVPRDRLQALRDQLRGVTAMVLSHHTGTPDADHDTLADSPDIFFESLDDEAAWSSRASAPIMAALHALRQVRTSSVLLPQGFAGGGAGTMIERATTNAEVRRVAELTGCQVITYLGREPPAITIHNEYRPYHDAAAPDDPGYVSALIDDIGGLESDQALLLARHALSDPLVSEKTSPADLANLRAAAVHSIMRFLSEFPLETSEEWSKVGELRSEMTGHLRRIAEYREPEAADELLMFLWLVANCLGDERLALLAEERMKLIGDQSGRIHVTIFLLASQPSGILQPALRSTDLFSDGRGVCGSEAKGFPTRMGSAPRRSTAITR